MTIDSSKSEPAESEPCNSNTATQKPIRLSQIVHPLKIVTRSVGPAAVKANQDPPILEWLQSYQQVPKLDLRNYVKVSQVGQGAYGDVWLAEDLLNKHRVALKKMKLRDEREGFPKTSIREITLLNSLRHKNIVELLGIVYSKPRKESRLNKGTMWMVFEYLPFDLSGYLHALRSSSEHHDRYIRPSTWLSLGEIKFITYQLLQALQFCHENSIMHRDLKSANLLMDLDGTIKLADFGLARFYNINISHLTNRVITLWYRPPELLFGCDHYTTAVDMWSTGCILAELLCGGPVFYGSNENAMLVNIYKHLGPLTEKDYRVFRSYPHWNSDDWNPFHYKHSLTLSDRSSEFEKAIKITNGAGEEGWNLIKRLMSWSPRDRISAQEALQHPWFRISPFPERLKDRAEVRAAHSFTTKSQKWKAAFRSGRTDVYIKHVNAGTIRNNAWVQQTKQKQVVESNKKGDEPLTSTRPSETGLATRESIKQLRAERFKTLSQQMNQKTSNLKQSQQKENVKDKEQYPLTPEVPPPPEPTDLQTDEAKPVENRSERHSKPSVNAKRESDKKQQRERRIKKRRELNPIPTLKSRLSPGIPPDASPPSLPAIDSSLILSNSTPPLDGVSPLDSPLSLGSVSDLTDDEIKAYMHYSKKSSLDHRKRRILHRIEKSTDRKEKRIKRNKRECLQDEGMLSDISFSPKSVGSHRSYTEDVSVSRHSQLRREPHRETQVLHRTESSNIHEKDSKRYDRSRETFRHKQKFREEYENNEASLNRTLTNRRNNGKERHRSSTKYS